MGRTLQQAVTLAGVGLHGGAACEACVAPAPGGHGLTLNGAPLADLALRDARRATTLQTPTGPVAMVEHLLGALVGLGVTDAAITVRGGEVPALDGSAAPWVAALALRETASAVTPWRPTAPVEVRDGERWIRVSPADRLTLSVTVEHPPAPRWRCETDLADFAAAIAPARTYGFMRDVERLRAAGLALGAGLHNALVLTDAGAPVAGAFHLPDEPARHKALDLLGDLARLGAPLVGRVVAWRPGHGLNHQLVEALRAQRAS